jgi:hypothetical protein
VVVSLYYSTESRPPLERRCCDCGRKFMAQPVGNWGVYEQVCHRRDCVEVSGAKLTVALMIPPVLISFLIVGVWWLVQCARS